MRTGIGDDRVTNKGMWKNIIAFGLASLLVSGVSWSELCLVQLWPKSLLVSGVNGRWIGLMEAYGKLRSAEST
jgi:hypothetical protein